MLSGQRTVMMVLAVPLVLASFQFHEVHACSCNANPEFLAAWSEADGAFQGTVKDTFGVGSLQEVVFDIHLVQKGDYPYGEYALDNSIDVYYDGEVMLGSSCDVLYKEGETYQVFVYGKNASIGSTNMCTTKQISGFEEYFHEDEHGQIQHHREHHSFFNQYGLFSLVLPTTVPAIVAGVAVWRRKRSDK